MTVKIHCTGQGASRLALDAFAAARQGNPNGPRHEIAHCSGVHDDEYPRFKELNVTAEMSPALFFKHDMFASSGIAEWNFKKMLQSNADMTIGSGWGAGEMPDLLPCMEAIVNDVGDGDRRVGGERICRLLTLAGAEAVGMEAKSGSIEVGKKASFITVSQDFERRTLRRRRSTRDLV